MQDEYGEMTAEGQIYVHADPFQLESGQVLEEAQLCYQTYGQLNEKKDNTLVVCHALTGNASLHAWWGDMLGPGKAFDTDIYFVVCCNILGSCYGSTNPTSMNPQTQQAYGRDFPDVSVKDTVRLQLELLTRELKLKTIHCVIGGSFGGMQTLEFIVQAGSQDALIAEAANGLPFVQSAVIIACGASHTAWQIGISEVQRQAIYADPNWKEDPLNAKQGLAIARQVGMVSYRTPKGYRQHFGRRMQSSGGTDPTTPAYGSQANWSVKSYLEYQGEKFLPRFDPVTYVKLTEQMDSHDLARGRADDGDVGAVLRRVDIPVLVMGIDTDVLYPLAEQEELVEHLPQSELVIIHSDDGHDGFLLEQEQMATQIIEFLDCQRARSQQPVALGGKQVASIVAPTEQSEQSGLLTVNAAA